MSKVNKVISFNPFSALFNTEEEVYGSNKIAVSTSFDQGYFDFLMSDTTKVEIEEVGSFIIDDTGINIVKAAPVLIVDVMEVLPIDDTWVADSQRDETSPPIGLKSPMPEPIDGLTTDIIDDSWMYGGIFEEGGKKILINGESVKPINDPFGFIVDDSGLERHFEVVLVNPIGTIDDISLEIFYDVNVVNSILNTEPAMVQNFDHLSPFIV